MELGYFTAEVRAGGLLIELPAEAKALHLKAGEKVQVRLDRELGAQPTQGSEPTPDQAPRKTLKGYGMFAGLLSTEDFLRRKHEETELEDRPIR